MLWAKLNRPIPKNSSNKLFISLRSSGKSKTQIARDLGISDSALNKWCKEFGEQGEEVFPGKGHQIIIEEEMSKLKRENEVLRQERDILKKAVSIFAQPQPCAFQFIHEHRHLFPILRMCQALDVSENGYNNWRRRGKSKRKQDDEQLAERIEDAFHKHRGKYGSPRIHAELQAQGIHCGRKRVARLMQEKQLNAGKKRRKARTTNSHHQFPIASNLLKRDFAADAPNKKWVADITFIETREGWLYLSGVLDTYSRKIVGWAMDKYHDADARKNSTAHGIAE